MRRIVFLILAMSAVIGCGVRQPIRQAIDLRPAMSPEDVTSVMGTPVKTEFSQGVMEWHYCKTGYSSDEFVALFFKNDQLVATRNYTVTAADAGAWGSCERFIKKGNYREPDVVTEIRLRM